MDKVTENLNPTVKTINKDDDGPADKQVLIRTTETERNKWKLAAEKEGLNLSQFIRDTINARAKELLECTHPTDQRRFYPWAEFCLKCNTRLRG